jgi:hypothetical protein
LKRSPFQNNLLAISDTRRDQERPIKTISPSDWCKRLNNLKESIFAQAPGLVPRSLQNNTFQVARSELHLVGRKRPSNSYALPRSYRQDHSVSRPIQTGCCPRHIADPTITVLLSCPRLACRTWRVTYWHLSAVVSPKTGYAALAIVSSCWRPLWAGHDLQAPVIVWPIGGMSDTFVDAVAMIASLK